MLFTELFNAFSFTFFTRLIAPRINNMTTGVRKEYIMEENMTDYQFKKLLQMVLTIINECETIEEAKEKISALLNE